MKGRGENMRTEGFYRAQQKGKGGSLAKVASGWVYVKGNLWV